MEASLSKQKELWQLAVDKMETGDRKSGLELFLSLENQGISQACVEIGQIYEAESCGGVDQNHSKAKFWYEKAIRELDDPAAYFALARLYYSGLGVEIDYQKAYEYLSMAEYADQPGACCMLGRMYELGYGVGQDRIKAFEYYQRAADGGHLLARSRLAILMIKRGQLISGFALWWKTFLAFYKVLGNEKERWRLNISWKPTH